MRPGCVPAASLGAGADPKVVQRVLEHASAAMTMDLYGHLIDRNLRDAADRFGGTTGHPRTRDRRANGRSWGKPHLIRAND